MYLYFSSKEFLILDALNKKFRDLFLLNIVDKIYQSLKIDTIKNMLINNNNKKKKYPDCSMETQLLKRIILWYSDVLAALLTPH